MVRAISLLVEHTIYIVCLMLLIWVVKRLHDALGLEEDLGFTTFNKAVGTFDLAIIVLIYSFACVHIAGALHGRPIRLWIFDRIVAHGAPHA